MNGKEKKKRPFGIFHAAVNAVTEAVYGFVGKSFIGKFFKSGDKMSDLVSESLLLNLLIKAKSYLKDKFKRRPKKVIGTEEFGRSVGIYNEASVKYPLKSRIIGSVENSVVVGALRSLLWKLVTVPMMSLGIFLLALGISVTVTQAVALFVSDTPVTSILTLGEGIIVLLFSLPALINREESVYDCVRGSLSGSFIMFSVMGCGHEKPEVSKSGHQFGIVLFCIGFFCGILTFKFSLLSIFIFMLAALCAVRIFYVPEFGVLLLLLLMPLFSLTEDPAALCAWTVIYVCVCFFIKAIIGKRSVEFTFIDFWVLLFGVIVLSASNSARTFGDSMSAALMNVSFMLGYFVIKNLIRSKKWVDRCINAFLASSLYVAIYALVQAVLTLDLHCKSVFSSQHTLAWFMIAAFVVSMAKGISSEKYKVVYFTLMAFQMAALFASGSIFALLILAAAVVVFFTIYSRRTVAVILLLILLVPVISCLVSGSDVSNFITYVTYSDVSQSYKVEVWGVSFDMIKDHLWFGIGMGNDVFKAAFASYSAAEMPVPSNSMSLLLQLVLQIGLFGVLFFAAILIILAVRIFTVYCKKGADRGQGICSLGIFMALGAMMVSGIFAYVWEEPMICLMFWVLTGLAESVSEIADSSARPEFDYLESISSDITIGF